MLTFFALNTLFLSVRLTPLLVASPIVFFSRIPITIRLILAISVAAVMASAIPFETDRRFTVLGLVGEFVLGSVMAFGFHAAHAGMDFVGKLIDAQIGLNAAGVFDPSSATVTGLVSEFLAVSFALLFVVLDFHLQLLSVFAGVFEIIPPGAMLIGHFDLKLIAILSQQFLLAFMILVPVVLGLWLTDISFAFLSRSMPQANIYFMALPIKIGFGAFLLLLCLPAIVKRVPVMFESALQFAASPL